LEEGQNPEASSVSLSSESAAPRRGAGNGELWGAQDEQYYGQSNGSGESRSHRWSYPANFEDASPALGSSTPKKKKKIKKDRFARTEDAYSITEDTPRRRKKRSKRSTVDDESTYSRGSESTGQVPEDPEGGNYGGRQAGVQGTGPGAADGARGNDDVVFDHQF
jgi:hypothetical protein